GAIDCGVTCSDTFVAGSVVTLDPTADAGSSFTDWAGTGCAGGVVTTNGPVTCTATFTADAVPPAPPLPVEVEVGDLTILVTNVRRTPVDPNAGIEAETTTGSGDTARVTLPAGALPPDLPPGSTFDLGVNDIAALLAQA